MQIEVFGWLCPNTKESSKDEREMEETWGEFKIGRLSSYIRSHEMGVHMNGMRHTASVEAGVGSFNSRSDETEDV